MMSDLVSALAAFVMVGFIVTATDRRAGLVVLFIMLIFMMWFRGVT